MKHFSCLILLFILAGCNEDNGVCTPDEKPESAQSAASNPVTEQEPDKVVFVLDQSLGMSGFVRIPIGTTGVPPQASEFTKFVSALVSLPVNSEAWQLPGSSAANSEMHTKVVSLPAEVKPQDCNRRVDACPNYFTYAYIDTFLDGALEGRTGIAGMDTPGENEKTLLVLITDLQPDIRSTPSRNEEKQSLVHDKLSKFLEKNLAIGILPVVSHFFGTVYDTQPKAGNPAPVLTSGTDRQPFFVIPIGKQEHVRWILRRLEKLRSQNAAESAKYKSVFLSGKLPDPAADPLKFERASLPDSITAGDAPTDASTDYKARTQAHLVLNLTQASKGDPAVSYRLEVTRDEGELISYEPKLSSEPMPAPRVWRSFNGPSRPPNCKTRWEDQSSLGYFKSSLVPGRGTDGSEDAVMVTLNSSNAAKLAKTGLYYIEQDVRVGTHPVSNEGPDWIKKWSLQPGWDKRISSADGVSVGVDSLNTLMQLFTPKNDPSEHIIQIRFSLYVAENG